MYEEYKRLSENEKKVIFGGRLGEYKYYDMDAVIASALDMCDKELADCSCFSRHITFFNIYLSVKS